jgi:hypothetical protein
VCPPNRDQVSYSACRIGRAPSRGFQGCAERARRLAGGSILSLPQQTVVGTASVPTPSPHPHAHETLHRQMGMSVCPLVLGASDRHADIGAQG